MARTRPMSNRAMTYAAQVLQGYRPFFDIYTDPEAEASGYLSPMGSIVKNELSMLSGAGTPMAIYGPGRLPHVQTSAGVWESPFRAAGLPDPKWDRATLDALLEGPEQKRKGRIETHTNPFVNQASAGAGAAQAAQAAKAARNSALARYAAGSGARPV